jgi:hypothetical protein
MGGAYRDIDARTDGMIISCIIDFFEKKKVCQKLPDLVLEHWNAPDRK